MSSDSSKPRNEFSDDERYRLKHLSLASFKGAYVNPADITWLEKMYRKNPKEYAAIGNEQRDQEIERIRGCKP